VKVINKKLIPLLAFCPSFCSASEVPHSLFGIELGSAFTVLTDDSMKTTNLPVTRITGMQKFMGSGVHIYFEPIKDYPEFDYKIVEAVSGSEYFKTTFSIYAFPVVPPDIKTSDQYQSLSEVEFEVAGIRWQDFTGTDQERYLKSDRLCSILKVDLEQSPTSDLDNFDTRYRHCHFAHENRKIESEFGGLSLDYTDEYFDLRNEEIKTQWLKLEANRIRPY